jgi:hypothetical protein
MLYTIERFNFIMTAWRITCANIDFKTKVNSAELLILLVSASLSVYPSAEGFGIRL